MRQSFYSCGKLMLCGEYAVLQGATTLALPTRQGQTLNIEELDLEGEPVIHWQSFEKTGECWFSTEISLPYFCTLETTDQAVSMQLVRFLITAKALNNKFLNTGKSYTIETELEFGKEDGLGSSSTLTNNIAQWAGIDPFELHFNAFKGSGFDVAVASIQRPILYQVNHHSPTIETFKWEKPFNEKLFFVHLKKKQNTRTEISDFLSKPKFTFTQIEELTRVSKLLAHTKDYFEFCLLLEIAENEVATALKRPTTKQLYFDDFNGTIKSLGAWGGDFILATGENTEEYFNSRGYHHIVPFKQMIKLEE